MVSWRHKLDSMQKYFEKICVDQGITIVRCDLPRSSGSGTSQIVSPIRTETVYRYGNSAMVYDFTESLNQGHAAVSTAVFPRVPEKSYNRSDDSDNIGFRCKVQNVTFEAIRDIIQHVQAAYDGQTRFLRVQTQKGVKFRVDSMKLTSELEKESQATSEVLNTNCYPLAGNKLIYLDEGRLSIGSSKDGKLVPIYTFPSTTKFSSFLLDVESAGVVAASAEHPGLLAFYTFS